MKKTKKAVLVLAAVLIFSAMAMASNSASALNVGDPIGDVLHTNVRTYIDGHRIPSYNIEGWMVVDTEHLMRYGFDVVFDAAARTLAVTRNPNRAFDPITNFDELAGATGTVAFRHLHTEIRALINGIPVRSFNVRGYLMILFEDLRDVGNFGTLAWDAAADELRLTLVNPVTSISLDRTNAAIRVNESVSLAAALTPANATNRTVTWSSGNSGIAQVDANGRVTGVSAGTTVITATASNGMSATSTVTVTPADIPVQSVTFDRTSANIRTGEILLINATLTPVNATHRTLTWSSSNPGVARIDGGRVTGVSEGSAIITATAANGLTATLTVTVVHIVDVTSVSLDRTSASIREGDVIQLTASVLPVNATDRTVTWSSSNASITQVDANGRVTGVSPGTATVTARTANGITANSTITVTRLGGFANFAVNTEYGPFTIRTHQQGGVQGQVINVSSFLFTRLHEVSFDNFELDMRIRGISSNSSVNVIVAFYDWNNNVISQQVIARDVTANQHFDFTERRTLTRNIIERAVRIEFFSSTNLPAEFGVSSANVNPAVFGVNREYAPFTLRTHQQAHAQQQIIQISSFLFTSMHEVSNNNFELAMRIRGNSSAGSVHFTVVFYDVNNNIISQQVIFNTVTANQHFDFTERRTLSRDIIDRTARIEFFSSTNLPAEHGALSGTAGNYWTGRTTYSNFPAVPDFAHTASQQFNNIRIYASVTVTNNMTAYNYDFSHLNWNTLLDTVWQNYIWALVSHGFQSTAFTGNEFVMFTRDNLTVTVWRSGAAVQVTIINN